MSMQTRYALGVRLLAAFRGWPCRRYSEHEHGLTMHLCVHAARPIAWVDSLAGVATTVEALPISLFPGQWMDQRRSWPFRGRGVLCYTIPLYPTVVRCYYRFFQFSTMGKMVICSVYIVWKNFLRCQGYIKRLDFIYYNNIILYISDNTHVLLIPPMNITRTTLKIPVVQN
jgi:hypothetical protein